MEEFLDLILASSKRRFQDQKRRYKIFREEIERIREQLKKQKPPPQVEPWLLP